jgi:hypothetical protein
MRFLEIFTSIGGAIGTVIVITAATAEGGNVEGLGNMIAALFHFAVISQILRKNKILVTIIMMLHPGY